MKDIKLGDQIVSQEQINGIKAGLSEIMQGCMTLNKVLTMMQIPEIAKFPNGRESVTCDSHVRCYERFKASLHDASCSCALCAYQ